jgi:hypothetical protein
VYGNWGYVKRELGIQLLSRPDVDTLVTGETVEWEVVPYVQDMIASGQKKALVLLGHVNSENGGMRYCAEWLRDFITEVPIGFIPAPEPFWNPALVPSASVSFIRSNQVLALAPKARI